jgi:choline dehydrogenase-like flavoprotein
MPIIDANEKLLEGDWAGFDVAIVGAGAAGIYLAVTLSRRGRRVLLIESGQFKEDDDRQSLNDLEQTGKRMANALWNRKRVLGGTTTVWPGGALPFTPLDFKKRDWVEHSGWPITYETLHPYFAVANRFMGIDERNYGSDILELFGREDPCFDPALIDYHYCKFATQPNFYKLHKSTLKREVTILYNAHLLRIDLGENGQVTRVEIGDFQGGRRTIRVKDFVLAAGGVETPRILLLNDHQVEGGLGSRSGWLGRAFMDHPCLVAGYVESRDPRRLQEWFGPRLHGMRRYSVRLSASADWQERNRLLNVSASLMWLYEGDHSGPFSELRSLVKRPRLCSAIRIAKGSGQLAKGLWAIARSGLIYKPGAVAKISLMCEQEPLRDSYIALSEQRDRFGARKGRLRCSSAASVSLNLTAVSHVLRPMRLGMGRARLLDSLRVDEPDYESRLSDVNHHMGGARMSASADGGVVNDQLQVWGVPNLYICSAAVFPTPSHANPTLTLLALAARLVERLAPQR